MGLPLVSWGLPGPSLGLLGPPWTFAGPPESPWTSPEPPGPPGSSPRPPEASLKLPEACLVLLEHRLCPLGFLDLLGPLLGLLKPPRNIVERLPVISRNSTGTQASPTSSAERNFE